MPVSSPPFLLNQADARFAGQLARQSGTEPRRCLLCRTCSNGCPLYSAMDLGPHRVMRLINFGMRDELLGCNTIWLCVSCQTCSACCPMSIDIASVMEALRHMALEEGFPVAEPAVVDFHRQVLGSIRRHGRTHKLEIMLRFKLAQGGLLSEVDLGLKMLAKRKLDLRPSRINRPEVLKGLFRPPWEAAP